jgi:hypothetical protein
MTLGVIALAGGCGSSPVLYRPMGKRELFEHRPPPVARGVTGVQPVVGGTGLAPVSGIEHRERYIENSRGFAHPYAIDVARWSEYIKDALASELGRLGIPTTSGPVVHVEVRSLDVDAPTILGPTTCRLTADALLRDGGSVRIHPVQADGVAEKSHTCIGRAVAAVVRHIVAAPWLAPEGAAPTGEQLFIRAPPEQAKLLPGTVGRYGMQLALHVGVAGTRFQGDDGKRSELAPSFALNLDFGLVKNLFFSGSIQGEAGGAGGLGVGLSGYIGGSLLLSASFLAGGGNEGTDVELPALGGQVVIGKQRKVTPSVWLGVAVRPFALWSLADGRVYGMSLLSTIAIN